MITNGAVDTSGGTNYKCTAVYTCDTGYILNGNITRTCQGDANWSGSEPTCDGMYSTLVTNDIIECDSTQYVGMT